MELDPQAQLKLVQDVAYIRAKVDDIETQVRKTNGQVKVNTEWINEQKGVHIAFATIGTILVIASGILGAILTAIIDKWK